jgi:YesN/AraC family two-component response regulator
MVITVLRMPKMTGTELIAALKEQYPELPVVLISGFALGDAEDQAAAGRADGFLAKPFRMEDIKRVLERFYVR